MSEQTKGWGPDNLWEEHPLYTLAWWRYEVANEDTLLGYRDWVNHQCAVDTE